MTKTKNSTIKAYQLPAFTDRYFIIQGTAIVGLDKETMRVFRLERNQEYKQIRTIVSMIKNTKIWHLEVKLHRSSWEYVRKAGLYGMTTSDHKLEWDFLNSQD